MVLVSKPRAEGVHSTKVNVPSPSLLLDRDENKLLMTSAKKIPMETVLEKGKLAELSFPGKLIWNMGCPRWQRRGEDCEVLANLGYRARSFLDKYINLMDELL